MDSSVPRKPSSSCQRNLTVHRQLGLWIPEPEAPYEDQRLAELVKPPTTIKQETET